MKATLALVFLSALWIQFGTSDLNISSAMSNDNHLAHASQPDSAIYDVVEDEPEFIGGEEAMHKFIKKNISYPVEAIQNGYEGKVYVMFIVEKDGSISNVNIARGAHPSLNEEALRVVRLMPNWTPGYQKGKAVRTRVVTPIFFKLDTQSEDSKKSKKSKKKKKR